MSSKRPRAWGSGEVVRFLREADLAEFETPFAEAEVTGAGLFALSDSDLSRLGLTRIKQRKRFYLALKSLDLRAASPPASPARKGAAPFAEDGEVAVVGDSDDEAKGCGGRPPAKKTKRELKSRSPEEKHNVASASALSLVARSNSTTKSTSPSPAISNDRSNSNRAEALYGPVGFKRSGLMVVADGTWVQPHSLGPCAQPRKPTDSDSSADEDAAAGTAATAGEEPAAGAAAGARSPEVRSPRSRSLASRKPASPSAHVDVERDWAGRTALLHAAWDGRHAEVCNLGDTPDLPCRSSFS